HRKVNAILLLTIALVIVACEGPIGPAGPQGEQGPVGPVGPGVMLTHVTGVVAHSDYITNVINFVKLEHSSITPSIAILVYMSPDPDQYAWVNVSEFQMAEGIIYISDSERTFLGQSYWIVIGENANAG
ncbi:hypothetical protein ACFLQV_04635, partial [Calditrichota bacterium]